jgi:hypothetical protein
MRTKMVFGFKRWRQLFAARVGGGRHPGMDMDGRDMLSWLSLQGESLMVSISLFSRMILCKKSATFWDHALSGPERG